MTSVVTLVVDEAVTRLDALAVVAEVSASSIDDAGTTRASVALTPSTRATVDVPKFGEAPPLAIDIISVGDRADALDAALALAGRLREHGWRVALDERH